MKQQTTNQTMYNSNQPNEKNRKQTKPLTTEISLIKTTYNKSNHVQQTTDKLMTQQTTNKTMNNKSQPNETTNNKPNHIQQQSG